MLTWCLASNLRYNTQNQHVLSHMDQPFNPPTPSLSRWWLAVEAGTTRGQILSENMTDHHSGEVLARGGWASAQHQVYCLLGQMTSH